MSEFDMSGFEADVTPGFTEEQIDQFYQVIDQSLSEMRFAFKELPDDAVAGLVSQGMHSGNDSWLAFAVLGALMVELHGRSDCPAHG